MIFSVSMTAVFERDPGFMVSLLCFKASLPPSGEGKQQNHRKRIADCQGNDPSMRTYSRAYFCFFTCLQLSCFGSPMISYGLPIVFYGDVCYN